MTEASPPIHLQSRLCENRLYQKKVHGESFSLQVVENCYDVIPTLDFKLECETTTVSWSSNTEQLRRLLIFTDFALLNRLLANHLTLVYTVDLMASPSLGNLVRLTPWHLDDIPAHPSIPASSQPKPDLLLFLLAVLNEGASFLSPAAFSAEFSPLGTKPAPPSTSQVEVHKRIIQTSALSQISWSSSSSISRRKPTSLETENWFSRRSRHKNVSSKEKKGSASWEEFVYGLRDEHSRHEFDFTPTLYDAHHILDWNDQVRTLEAEGKLGEGFSNVTMSIYEMCHLIPAPLGPRCFSVLVITASTSPTSFLAVTLPIDLSLPSPLPASFYTSKRNVTEGTDAQQRKSPVVGVYAAVETVFIQDDGEIEWTMATASDAKGVLPMWAQKMSMPGMVVKDVSFFMEWIPKVSEEDIKNQKIGTH